MRTRDWGWLVLVLFFCSGATALVYEVVWSKFLSQMFGSTIYAQTVVLAAFMGGLALGNRIFGRWADRWQQPVRAYGYLEIAIGLYAFFFPAFDRAADWVFVAVGTGIAERTAWLLALKGLLSAALLLGPTILMGGTLPLLSAWLQRSSVDAGRRTALFYAINSFGAVVGAALAGFWLVQNLGMVSSLQMTALVNVIIGTTAGLLSRSRLLGRMDPNESASTVAADTTASWKWHWAGVIVAMTGAVSMGLEVLASRSLVMIFGSSLQSFAIVLIAFILGIGLGSVWIASPQWREGFSKKLIVLLLCAAAAWVTLLVFNIERWVDFYRIARTGLGRNGVGYVYNELLNTGIALVVLGVPATCIGAVLPLMIRVVSREGKWLGARVGTLLTWNTLGAVAGTLLTGFLLMPLAGLRNSFGVLALALALAALAVAWRQGWWAGMMGGAAVIGLTGCLFIFGGEGWRYVISSGAFRSHETVYSPMAMALRKQHVKILFYDDAPDATVSVEEAADAGESGERGLCINGKPDASSRHDFSTQLLLAHLPMLARPGARDVFIFGLGSGISAGALLPYPAEKIVVAENCEPVVRASQYFTNWNHRVLQDRRVHLWHEDARTVFKLNPQLYDVIIAEPSNPWTVGIGSVFSREFYQLAASRLKPGGIMVQWFHIYEMHDGIVELVLRTFNSVFPNLEIWDACNGDIVLLGSLQPWQTGPDAFRQGFVISGVRSDFAQIGIHSPEALMARQLASQQTAFAIAGNGPMQSDLFPVLEYAAPRAFYIGDVSWILERYDERTSQQLLAPAGKLAMLHALPAKEVQSVFSEFTTVNLELLICLRRPADSGNTPCVFNTNSPKTAIPALPDTNAVNAPALNRAARLVGGTREQQREAVALIESVVAAPSSSTNRLVTEWASLAATVALGSGDLERAGRLAALALKQDPANVQAAFVTRIIERRRQLPPAAGRPSVP
ncbi:MAG: fused MFS/spermidine synthase [Verrucomicrobiota bacterium]|jgi:predicted membrane-bound spermidine synthase